MKKHLRSVLLVSALCFSVSAYAFLQFAPAVLGGSMWLYRAGVAAFEFKKVSEIVVFSSIVGTAVALAQPQLFERLALGNTDANTSQKIPLSLDPNGTRSRENPDPQRWQSDGSRDYSPKSTFSTYQAAPTGTPTVPSGISAIGTALGANSCGTFTDSTGVIYWGRVQAATPDAAPTTLFCSGVDLPRYSTSIFSGYMYYSGRPAQGCPTGYTMSGTTCTLSVAAATIRKPATQPCEVVKTSAGSWEVDSRNPNCDGLAAKLSISGSKMRTVSIGDSGSQWAEVEASANDSGTIRYFDGSKTWEMPYSPSATSPGSYAIPSVTLVSDTGTGTGTGTSTGTGSSSINWICGVAPLPPCSVAVDSTGVPTMVDSLANPSTVISDTFRTLDSKVSNPESAGWWPAFPLINWTFALPTSCSVLSIPDFAPFLSSIDVCQFQPIFHSVMSVVWAIGGLFGAIGLFWRNVMATQ